MCDGFSEAFMAMAAGASEGMGAMAGGYTAMAGAGEAAGSAASLAAANAGALAGAGAAGLSGFSAYTQASAARQANVYQAQVDQNNALIAGYQGSAAVRQGGQQAQLSMLQSAQVYGQQRADLAANGVDLSSGSALDQLASTRFLNQQDVNAIQSNAARAAWGYQVQGQSDQINAALSSWQARNNNPAGIGALSGGGSLLSSAALFAV
jgi:hypothetical protein